MEGFTVYYLINWEYIRNFIFLFSKYLRNTSDIPEVITVTLQHCILSFKELSFYIHAIGYF
jgi:hypothetical protein